LGRAIHPGRKPVSPFTLPTHATGPTDERPFLPSQKGAKLKPWGLLIGWTE